MVNKKQDMNCVVFLLNACREATGDMEEQRSECVESSSSSGEHKVVECSDSKVWESVQTEALLRD